MNIKELDLLEEKEIRERFISRIEVLDKVKELILLPNTECANIQQVADYYEIEEKTLQVLVDRNTQELEHNGYVRRKQSEVISELERNPQVVETVNTQWYKEIIFKNGFRLKVNNAGIRLFARRAILNVGMLLRDSEVAKEIRNYLLNIESHSTDEQKDIEVESLNEEDKIALKVLNAKDKMGIALAMNEYKRFKDKELEKKDVKIKALVDGELRWDKRAAVNKMVRKIADTVFGRNGKNGHLQAWFKLRSEMLYKHNIHVTKRIQNSSKKNATIFDVLNDEELSLAVKSCVALCEMYGIDSSNILYKE